LDNPGGSRENLTEMIQWDLNKNNNQVWVIRPVNGQPNYYMIVNLESSLVLDIASPPENEGRVLQYSWHGGDNQLWSIEPLDNGYYVVRNKFSGYVLTIHNESKESGEKVIHYHYYGHPGQHWSFGANNVVYVKPGDTEEAKTLISLFSEKFGGNIRLWKGEESAFHFGQEGYDVLYVQANTGSDEGILFVMSAEASAAVFHFAGTKGGIETADFDFLVTQVKASVGWYNGISLSFSLIQAKASVFDLNLGFGLSTGFGIKDDSLDVVVAGVGFCIGRRVGIKVLDNEIAVDFGRCITM